MGDWVIQFVEQLGEVGVFLLMLLENVFPPIPSELIMPLAGYLAQSGNLDFWSVVAAGSIGSLAGTSVWYVIGRRVGEPRLRHWIERYGKWLTVSTEDLDRSEAWFARHRGAAVFFCRLIPALRSVVSLPAGFSGMPLPQFLFYSSFGTVAWTVALTYAGFLLGQQYSEVDKYLGPVSWLVIGISMILYIVRVVQLSRRRRSR